MALKWSGNNTGSTKSVIQDNLDWAKARRKEGWTYGRIADELGVSRSRLAIWLDPDRKAREDEYNRMRKGQERKRQPIEYKVNKIHFDNSTRVEVLGELPPPDTRNFTQRFFGDPLPGRSYLDRMRNAQNKTV
jgi:predicted transcriptional regulator